MQPVNTDALTTKKLWTTGKSQEEKRITSEYIERERNWLNEAVKQQERPRIAEFFLRHHADDEPLRLLSLPSVHWSFETMLAKLSPHRKCRFYGLEWTWGVIEIGRPFMPGSKHKISHVIPLAIGEIEAIITQPPEKSNPAVVSHALWVEAGSFLSLTDSEIGPSVRRHRFGKVYRRMSCAWLDFTSQLCAEVRKSLQNVGSSFNPAKPDCPFAVTLMAARDNHAADETRVKEIEFWLNANEHRRFELIDWWKYLHHEIPMLTVCGLMRLC